MNEFFKSKLVKDMMETGELPPVTAKVSIAPESIVVLATAVLLVGAVLIIAKKLL